ncbi:MAG TPA: hypothetical protein VFC15_07660 [Candidatus Limnocylindrales bacterium]|nr:hypothetical protein [Candidatus Limnocylindrales bacterium]HZM10071.1 hypothetical protein [Candidatus Limnocylindrales bacterium]
MRHRVRYTATTRKVHRRAVHMQKVEAEPEDWCSDGTAKLATVVYIGGLQ